MGLREDLKRFINTSRGRGRLDPAPERDAIGIAVSEGLPTANEPASGGGVDSPLVEQAYTGSTWYSLTSSDGFFVFEFGDQTEYTDNDGAGSTIVVKHIDPDA